MFPPAKQLPRTQRKLLELFARLPPGDRQTLLAFAEFLVVREERQGTLQPPQVPPEPVPVPRPEQETVVAAMRRLTTSYHMLDRSALLNESASLMSAHVLHGRPATVVIDQLEELFETHYRAFLASHSG